MLGSGLRDVPFVRRAGSLPLRGSLPDAHAGNIPPVSLNTLRSSTDEVLTEVIESRYVNDKR